MDDSVRTWRKAELTGDDPSGSTMLVVTAGALDCGIPLSHVAEIMRPLPIEPIAGMPHFVRGIALIRGAPTPVVNLMAILNGEHLQQPKNQRLLKNCGIVANQITH